MSRESTLPPGIWIEYHTVAMGLGIPFSDLRKKATELGITPLRMPRSLRYFSDTDVAQLQGGGLVPMELFPTLTPEEVRVQTRSRRASKRADVFAAKQAAAQEAGRARKRAKKQAARRDSRQPSPVIGQVGIPIHRVRKTIGEGT